MSLSVFEIIGPPMVGPSSSHTAGACRLGWVARQLLGPLPVEATIQLHGSFAATGDGHGTKEALAAGLLGLDPDDLKLKDALQHAANRGCRIQFGEIDLGPQAHPNSVEIRARSASEDQILMRGSSVGGGSILVEAIDGFATELKGSLETLVLWHNDAPGFLAHITAVLACAEINVAGIQTSRSARGEEALTCIEIDGRFPAEVLALLPLIRAIRRHAVIPTVPGL